MAYIVKAKNDEQTVLASSEKTSDPIIVMGDNWYFHPGQVSLDVLKRTDRIWKCPDRGIGYWYDLSAPGMKVRNVAWIYPDADGDYVDVAGLIGFWGRETPVSVSEDTVDA